MNNFYIYKFSYKEVEKNIKKVISATVIFCDREDIKEDNLKEEIRRFYQTNYQTDKIYVIAGEYLREKINEVFVTNQESIFKGIPKRQETHLSENLYLLTFDSLGQIKCVNGKTPSKEFIRQYLNEGLQNIFLSRGGLVTAHGAHHYVFPSGKHCDKFLRTGNILLVSSEIYFIAFAMLKLFDESRHQQIYCDTSSINSVAFALIELKNRFLGERKMSVSIESFSSYNGLYKNELTYGKQALLLISASTSANIINYILERQKIIDRSNIVIMFFLGVETNFLHVKDQVLCNLTLSKENPNGIELYTTYQEKECKLCDEGSYAVEVAGDVFLLENPKINKITLKLTDADRYLSDFVKQFKSFKREQTVLKVNYKENSDSGDKYEIYIDFNEILNGLESHNRYKIYEEKLNNYINQYVPSNTKYIVSLNDSASKRLSNYILKKISSNYKAKSLPIIISQDDIPSMRYLKGTVLIVGSCISNGKNLLYISRAMRKFDGFRLVYFIGISRTKQKESLTALKGNLKQGFYGAESNSFIEVDKVHCDNSSRETAWILEINFLKKFIEFVLDVGSEKPEIIRFLKERKRDLENSSGEHRRGLAEKLFYPRIVDGNYEELTIRKNFAFFNFDGYDKHVTQSEIFYTISNIINGLRNEESLDRNLLQTAFVRNLISPENFNRFNDGIIQASILRSARPDELAYSLDFDTSEEMYNLLETIVKYSSDEQGEALIEFLYAIATEKMSLRKPHLQRLIDLIKDKISNEIILCFAEYIACLKLL